MKTNKLSPIHPGEILREEFMKPHGLSQNALARALNVPPRRINEIVLEKRGISADTALRLARYFGIGLDEVVCIGDNWNDIEMLEWAGQAIVMGNAGVQRGLALYPGKTMPPGLRSPGPKPGPGAALEATPAGTLLLMLDRLGETPTAFADKALRYGWPAGAAYLPTLVSVGPEGPGDLAGVDARRMQVAIAAVVALDARGLALAGGAGAMTGRVALADGAHGEFEIIQRPLLS